MEHEPVVGEPFDWMIFHFSADYAAGELIVTEEGEAIMLTADELRHEKLFPSLASVIDRILDPGHGPIFSYIEYNAEKTVITRQSYDVAAGGAANRAYI